MKSELNPHEVMGWMYAEACHMADAGEDIRKANVPKLKERMERDLAPSTGGRSWTDELALMDSSVTVRRY